MKNWTFGTRSLELDLLDILELHLLGKIANNKISLWAIFGGCSCFENMTKYTRKKLSSSESLLQKVCN